MIGGSSSSMAAVAGRQAQAGRGLEFAKARKGDLALKDARVKLDKRRARVSAFEIVFGPEQALPSGLALSARDRAEAVEALGDRRKKALLALHIGGDGPEQRRLRLIGAVRAAKALNGGIGLPARLQHVMHALSLVPRRKIGVIAAPGAARVREDEDALLVVHEALRLGEVGGAGTVFDGEPRVTVGDFLDDAAVAARHFGDLIRTEVMQDLVERGLHGRQATPAFRSAGRGSPRPRAIARAGRRPRRDARGCCRSSSA